MATEELKPLVHVCNVCRDFCVLIAPTGVSPKVCPYGHEGGNWRRVDFEDLEGEHE